MKLSKAINLNKEAEKSLRQHKFINYANAVALGREALKRILKMRQDNAFLSPPSLPGETLETSNPAAETYLKRLKESPLGREPKG